MDEKTIKEILNGSSRELEGLKNNSSVVLNFLNLIRTIDSLPDITRRSFEESRSLYDAVSKNRDIQTLEKQIEEFFNIPSKPAGKRLPLLLRFNPTVRALGGIRKEQSLFISKLPVGEFYGTLWPWQIHQENITIRLGFYYGPMSDEDHSKLEELVQKTLS